MLSSSARSRLMRYSMREQFAAPRVRRALRVILMSRVVLGTRHPADEILLLLDLGAASDQAQSARRRRRSTKTTAAIAESIVHSSLPSGRRFDPVTRGHDPVGVHRADAGVAETGRAPCRRGPMPVRLNSNRSCIITTSPSIPVISEILITLREPSDSRLTCTTMLIAEAICWRIARCGIDAPDSSIIISSRCNASRGVFAWMVQIEPS